LTARDFSGPGTGGSAGSRSGMVLRRGAADGRGRRGVARARAVLGSPVHAPQAVAASGASAAQGGSPPNTAKAP